MLILADVEFKDNEAVTISSTESLPAQAGEGAHEISRLHFEIPNPDSDFA